MKKPLLLAPAGSYEALVSAINAGADEVYFGAKGFNARYGAKNFTDVEFKNALKLCKLYGVKSNITVNTLVTDREMTDALNLVYNAACEGADCFIVQDLGLASLIKKTMPDLQLHASTQCACHSLEGAKKLIELGFSRVVLARELSAEDIRQISSHGFETEIFVHGALCVCHSGMCLMSSVIGKRSGNRGMCAQPCRLPYGFDGKANSYPMSLKDLSLSRDIQQLLGLGVTSLKIEGRMKSPEYVFGTVGVWRELLDSGVSADIEQYQRLSDLFSRGGFTNAYFTGQYRKNNRNMYGVRSDGDKKDSKRVVSEIDTEGVKKVKVSIDCKLCEGQNAVVFVKCRDKCVKVTSDFVCESAKNAPLDEEQAQRALSKLGNTVFEAKEVNAEIDGSIFLSKSQLNALRRSAFEALEKELTAVHNIKRLDIPTLCSCKRKVQKSKTHLCFRNAFEALTCKELKNADLVSLPLEFFDEADKNVIEKVKQSGACMGVVLPRVLFNGEYENARTLLERAKKYGAQFALVSNVGQIELCRGEGYTLFAGLGMNVYNSFTRALLENEGFDVITMSPELNSAQMRDMVRDKSELCVFAKGFLPLMVLESCIVRANGKCELRSQDGCKQLCDRKGYNFAVCGQKRLVSDNNGGLTSYPCRNVIYNSVRTDILQKQEEMSKINADIVTILL